MKSETRSRTAAIAALTLALSGGLVVGCGGDSAGGGPWDAFTGRWFQVAPDPVADPFGTCCWCDAAQIHPAIVA